MAPPLTHAHGTAPDQLACDKRMKAKGISMSFGHSPRDGVWPKMSGSIRQPKALVASAFHGGHHQPPGLNPDLASVQSGAHGALLERRIRPAFQGLYA